MSIYPAAFHLSCIFKCLWHFWNNIRLVIFSWSSQYQSAESIRQDVNQSSGLRYSEDDLGYDLPRYSRNISNGITTTQIKGKYRVRFNKFYDENPKQLQKFCNNCKQTWFWMIKFKAGSGNCTLKVGMVLNCLAHGFRVKLVWNYLCVLSELQT